MIYNAKNAQTLWIITLWVLYWHKITLLFVLFIYLQQISGSVNPSLNNAAIGSSSEDEDVPTSTRSDITEGIYTSQNQYQCVLKQPWKTVEQPHILSTVICREITWSPAWQSWRSTDFGPFSSRFRVTHWFLFLECSNLNKWSNSLSVNRSTKVEPATKAYMILYLANWKVEITWEQSLFSCHQLIHLSCNTYVSLLFVIILAELWSFKKTVQWKTLEPFICVIYLKWKTEMSKSQALSLSSQMQWLSFFFFFFALWVISLRKWLSIILIWIFWV